jgi:hypothetical protein
VNGRRRLFVLRGLSFAAPGGNAANAKHETDFYRDINFSKQYNDPRTHT